MSEEDKPSDISQEVLESSYPGRGKIYLDFLSSCAEWLDPDDARAMYKELTLGGITLDYRTLNRLRQITAIAEASAPESVIRARQALRNYFTHSEHGRALRQTGAIIIVTGSIQYGDPRHLDADLRVIPSSTPTPDLKAQLRLIDSELARLWAQEKLGLTNFGEPHLLATFSLDYFRDTLEQIRYKSEDFYDQAGVLAQAISGTPLFHEDKPMVSLFSSVTQALAETDPLLCTIVNHHLQNTLKTRLSRRNGGISESDT